MYCALLNISKCYNDSDLLGKFSCEYIVRSCVGFAARFVLRITFILCNYSVIAACCLCLSVSLNSMASVCVKQDEQNEHIENNQGKITPCTIESKQGKWSLNRIHGFNVTSYYKTQSHSIFGVEFFGVLNQNKNISNFVVNMKVQDGGATTNVQCLGISICKMYGMMVFGGLELSHSVSVMASIGLRFTKWSMKNLLLKPYKSTPDKTIEDMTKYIGIDNKFCAREIFVGASLKLRLLKILQLYANVSYDIPGNIIKNTANQFGISVGKFGILLGIVIDIPVIPDTFYCGGGVWYGGLASRVSSVDIDCL